MRVIGGRLDTKKSLLDTFRDSCKPSGEAEIRYMNIKNSASRGQISRVSRQRPSLAMENAHFSGTSLSCWAGNPSNRREDATLTKVK